MSGTLSRVQTDTARAKARFGDLEPGRERNAPVTQQRFIPHFIAVPTSDLIYAHPSHHSCPNLNQVKRAL
jgi:hypothetical protein